MNEKELQEMMIDIQNEYTASNRTKDKIIITLIVLMFLEAVTFFSGFVWYESQFEYVDTVETQSEQTVDLSSEGENANVQYNDVEGNQYNDNAVHNESGESE